MFLVFLNCFLLPILFISLFSSSSFTFKNRTQYIANKNIMKKIRSNSSVESQDIRFCEEQYNMSRSERDHRECRLSRSWSGR
jgi:hypothetical protein